MLWVVKSVKNRMREEIDFWGGKKKQISLENKRWKHLYTIITINYLSFLRTKIYIPIFKEKLLFTYYRDEYKYLCTKNKCTERKVDFMKNRKIMETDNIGEEWDKNIIFLCGI